MNDERMQDFIVQYFLPLSRMNLYSTVTRDIKIWSLIDTQNTASISRHLWIAMNAVTFLNQ